MGSIKGENRRGEQRRMEKEEDEEWYVFKRRQRD